MRTDSFSNSPAPSRLILVAKTGHVGASHDSSLFVRCRRTWAMFEVRADSFPGPCSTDKAQPSASAGLGFQVEF